MGILWQIVLLLVCFSLSTTTGRLYKRHPSFLIQNKLASSEESLAEPKEWINVRMTGEEIVKVAPGSRVELECEAIGTPPPRTEWFFEDSSLFQVGFEEQNVVLHTAIGKVKSRLVIDCATLRYQGSYTCAAIAGSKMQSSAPTTLLVQGRNVSERLANCDEKANHKPRIIMWGPTLLEINDNDVLLPCAAVGNPKPEMYWIDNNNRVIYPDTVSSHYKVLPNGDLFISKITWQEDMGIYTCVAQNAFGEDKAETFLYPVKKE